MRYKLIITALFETTGHEQKINDFLKEIGEADIYIIRTFEVHNYLYTEILHDKQSTPGKK